MEVHQHTHTPRKKWIHYFWEFLMLFLAVFAGFLAENQREYYVEHHREKQYIKSFIEDLNDDIILADEQVILQKGIIIQMDSLVEMLGRNKSSQANTSQLYYLGRIAPRGIRFFNNDRTIEQMKNSGGFRLIRNQEAAKRIMSYYREIDIIKYIEKREDDEQETYKRIAAKIFDPIVFKDMVSGADILRIETNPPLLTSDELLLKELAGAVQYIIGSRNRIVALKQVLKVNATSLVNFLKEKYRLK